jgi:hypothetical protein
MNILKYTFTDKLHNFKPLKYPKKTLDFYYFHVGTKLCLINYLNHRLQFHGYQVSFHST